MTRQSFAHRSSRSIPQFVLGGLVAFGFVMLGVWLLVADVGYAGEPPPSTLRVQDPDFPLVPPPPGGIGAPVPPTGRKGVAPSDPSTAVDDRRLVVGTGTYRGMLLIPAGPFEMGSTEDQGNPDEQPRHKVFVKDFYISLREVTVKAFCEFLNAQGETGKDGRPRLKLDAADSPVVKKGKRFQPKSGAELFPMVLVSWYGAVDFAEWAGGRLPSAAEWEKAAAYATPRSANDRPRAAKRDGPVPVKSAVPGVQGITGLVGNVWEWCSDWYAADYYSQSPPENPTGPETGQEKEIRGGSWASVEWSVRVQNRHKASPKGAYRTIGFRIVKD